MVKKIERREGTTTEGRGLGHSFAADNVARGDADADFVKRRPTYPIGDDPRGREIDFEDETGDESYGRNQVFRAYRGQAPIEGQEFGMPSRVGALTKVSQLRPELFSKSVDTVVLDAQKALDRQALEDSDFGLLFPQLGVASPAPGSTFSPGSELRVEAHATDLRGIYGATLEIDGKFVERKAVHPSERDSARDKVFVFFYQIPSNQLLGTMDITVRAFNISTSMRGFVADDAINLPPQGRDIDLAVGTLDGRIGRLGSTSKTNPQLQEGGMLRAPEAVVNFTINIV